MKTIGIKFNFRQKVSFYAAMAWVSSVFCVAAAIAGTKAQTCEKKIERWLRLNPEPQKLVCEVLVTKKNQDASADQSLWRANHQTEYCKGKLESHAQRLKDLGWSCEEKGPFSWYCYQKSERQVDLSWANEETQLSCQVTVRRSEEGFSLIHRFWSAKHEKHYCQNKFDGYLKKKTQEGWACSDSLDSSKLVKGPESEEKVALTEDEDDNSSSDDSQRQTASESLMHEQRSSKAELVFLEVEPVFNFSRIDAIDNYGAEAIVASKGLNVGARLSLEAKVYSSWSAYASFSGVHSQLQSHSTNGDLKKGNQFLWGSALGVKNLAHKDFEFGAEVGLSKQPFLTLDNSNVLAVETVNVPEFNIRGRYLLIQGGGSDWGTEAKLGYLFPSSSDLVNAQSGMQYRLSFLGQTTLLSFPVQAQFYFQHRIQKTSLMDWSTKELGFLVSIDLGLF